MPEEGIMAVPADPVNLAVSYILVQWLGQLTQ